MKVNFQMMVHVVMEYIIMVMRQYMKVIGLMIHKKLLVLKLGKIILFIKENIKMVKKTELEHTNGMIIRFIKVNGKIMI